MSQSGGNVKWLSHIFHTTRLHAEYYVIWSSSVQTALSQSRQFSESGGTEGQTTMKLTIIIPFDIMNNYSWHTLMARRITCVDTVCCNYLCRCFSAGYALGTLRRVLMLSVVVFISTHNTPTSHATVPTPDTRRHQSEHDISQTWHVTFNLTSPLQYYTNCDKILHDMPDYLSWQNTNPIKQ